MAHVGDELRLVLAGDFEIFNSLGKLARACLHFFEQAGVLDGYDSLTCKILKKLNLFVGERSYLLTINGEDTNEGVLLKQRHDESGPRSAALHGADDKRIASKIAGALPKVRRVNWLAVCD